MELIVTEDDVLFEIVSDRVSVVPITTAPNVRLGLVRTTLPGGAVFLDPARPWQPVRNNRVPPIKLKMAR